MPLVSLHPIVSCFLLLATPPTVPSGLSGRVLDRETGEPVSLVVVRLEGRAGHALTGSDGSFSIVEVPSGVRRLQFQHVRYHTRTLLVQPGAGPLTVLLEPRRYLMPSVVVTPRRTPYPLGRAGGLFSLDPEAIRSIPNPEDDVVRALRRLPGVSSHDFSARIHVRGGREDEVVVRLDGLELRDPYHVRDLGGLFSVFHLESVSRLDLYLGGYPAAYGDRLSGVMDVRLTEGPFDSLRGSIAAGLGSARTTLRLPRPQGGGTLVAARYGYLDALLDRVEEDYVIRPRYADLLLKVNLPDPAWSVAFLGTWDRLVYDEPYDEKDLDTRDRDGHLWARHRLEGGTGWTLESVGSLDLLDRDRRPGVGGRDDREVREGALRQELSRPWLPGHEFSAGWGIEFQGARRERVETRVTRVEDGVPIADTVRTEVSEPRIWKTHGFVQDTWDPLPHLRLGLGLRFDFQDRTAYPQWSPRLAAAWNPAREWTIRGAWGLYFQSPDLGDPELEEVSVSPERAVHAVLGVERTFGARGGFRIEAYRKRYGRRNLGITVLMDGETRRVRPEEARADGMDVFLKWSPVEGLRATGSYSLSRATWTADGVAYDQLFDRRHAVSLDLGLRPDSAWEAHLSWSYHSGTPYTEEIWRTPASTPGRNWYLVSGSPAGARYPDYHRLDMRVRRRFRWGGCRLVVNAEVLNLYDHDNVRHYSWIFHPTSATTYEPTRVTRTYLPLLPAASVELYF
jgi:outer membrane receptor protein involved in Fe transport